MFGLDTSCANNENDLSLLDPLLNLPNDIITDEPMASVLQNEKDEQFEKNSLESILDEHNNSSFSIDTPKTPEIVANVQSVPITKPPKVLHCKILDQITRIRCQLFINVNPTQVVIQSNRLLQYKLSIPLFHYTKWLLVINKVTHQFV